MARFDSGNAVKKVDGNEQKFTSTESLYSSGETQTREMNKVLMSNDEC